MAQGGTVCSFELESRNRERREWDKMDHAEAADMM